MRTLTTVVTADVVAEAVAEILEQGSVAGISQTALAETAPQAPTPVAPAPTSATTVRSTRAGRGAKRHTLIVETEPVEEAPVAQAPGHVDTAIPMPAADSHAKAAFAVAEEKTSGPTKRAKANRAAHARHESTVETPAPQQDADAAAADLFEQAQRMFSGAIPVASAAQARTETPDLVDEPVKTQQLPEYLGTSPRRSRSNFKRITTTALSVSAVGVATLMAVSMALSPVASGSSTAAAASVKTVTGADPEELQAFVASSDVQNADLDRAEGFETVTSAQIAAETGINYSNAVFVNNPNSPIQWPFKVGTGMSYGYGMRDGVLHAGIDFTPGAGAPIQAIADGVVRTATENGGGYGVTVYIDHVIDGETITSHYSHMQYGSIKVVEGQQVKVGDIVGLTGNTGRSFGAHLHFELIVNGSTIDPMPWLRSHAGG